MPQIAPNRLIETTRGFDLSRAVRKLRARHFELLRLLARAKSLRAAASQMDLTPPALSNFLKEVGGCIWFTTFPALIRRIPSSLM